MRNHCVPENYVFDTFISVALSHPFRGLEVHINDIMGIISYSENHDSTLMLVFYYFYMSPLQISSISLLRVILFRSYVTNFVGLVHRAFNWNKKYNLYIRLSVNFFENIAQTKIVDHKIIYKKCLYTFSSKDHHS